MRKAPGGGGLKQAAGQCGICGRDANVFFRKYFAGGAGEHRTVLAMPNLQSKVVTTRGNKVTNVQENAALLNTKVYSLTRCYDVCVCAACVERELRKYRGQKLVLFVFTLSFLSARIALGALAAPVHPYVPSALTVGFLLCAFLLLAFSVAHSKRGIVDDMLKSQRQPDSLSAEEIIENRAKKRDRAMVSMTDEMKNALADYENT